MGWWSTGILGGDTPYDFKDEIYEICEVEEFDDSTVHHKIPKKTFADKLPEILEYIEASDYDKEIGYQVLGVMMMEVGAEIGPELKEKMILAAQEDVWAQEDEERKAVMEQFVQSLRSYESSTPIVIRTPGLFETIAKKMNEGSTGLVNL